MVDISFCLDFCLFPHRQTDNSYVNGQTFPPPNNGRVDFYCRFLPAKNRGVDFYCDCFPPKPEESISIAEYFPAKLACRFLFTISSRQNENVEYSIDRDLSRWTMDDGGLRSPPQTPTPTTPTTYHGPEP